MSRKGHEGKHPKRKRKKGTRDIHRVMGVSGEGSVSQRDKPTKRRRGIRKRRNRQLERQVGPGRRGQCGVYGPEDPSNNRDESPVGRAVRKLESVAQERAQSDQTGLEDGLAWVYKDGRLRRALPPELTTPAVGAGPGLESGIPLPLQPEAWRPRVVCRCCADIIPALSHAIYCPLYVAPVVRVTGCQQCDTTQEPHFHDKHVLYEAGRELF